MIWFAPFLAMQISTHANLEFCPPLRKGVITVEALVKISPEENRDILAAVCEAISRGTDDYSKPEIDALVFPTGDQLKVDLLPDCVRIQFSVLAQDSASVAPLFASLLRSATISDEAVSLAKSDLQAAHRPVWNCAVWPRHFDGGDINKRDMLEVYQHVFQPGMTTITIAADPQFLSIQRQLEDAEAAWRHPSTNYRFAFSEPGAIDTARTGKVSSLVLRGKSFDPNSPKFPSISLALFALGSGKGALLWKELRQARGWSYRQEAILRSSATGVQPVVALVSGVGKDDLAHAHAIRSILLAGIDKWTDEDVTRAEGMAQAVLKRDVGMNPFYWFGDRPAYSLQDHLFLQTYWRMLTLHDWDEDQILSAMGKVPLAEMRQSARTFVEEANIELVTGRD